MRSAVKFKGYGRTGVGPVWVACRYVQTVRVEGETVLAEVQGSNDLAFSDFETTEEAQVFMSEVAKACWGVDL